MDQGKQYLERVCLPTMLMKENEWQIGGVHTVTNMPLHICYSSILGVQWGALSLLGKWIWLTRGPLRWKVQETIFKCECGWIVEEFCEGVQDLWPCLLMYPEFTCVSHGNEKICIFNTIEHKGVVVSLWWRFPNALWNWATSHPNPHGCFHVVSYEVWSCITNLS